MPKPVVLTVVLIFLALDVSESRILNDHTGYFAATGNESLVDVEPTSPNLIEDEQPEAPVKQIASIVNGTLELQTFVLDSILYKIEDFGTKVGIVSIAGEFRKGKSFLLNFILQYLGYRENHPAMKPTATKEELHQLVVNKSHPYLRDVVKSEGFHFKSGVNRDTTGVTMFKKPFEIQTVNGEKLAVLVMDTQGLYDKSTSSDDNVRLFSMASLLSSNLLYNTGGNINADEFLKVKDFTDYASTGSQRLNGTKPFQKLTFLIRDTTLTESLGYAGGQEILSQFMDENDDEKTEEVRAVARNLTEAFTQIDAFALPPPGNHVTKRKYNGSLVLIDPEFLHHLEAFVIKTVDSLEARKPLVIPLTRATTASYFGHVIDTLNKQISPSELMLIKERTLVIGTFRRMEKSVHAYEAEMKGFVSQHNDSYFTSRHTDQIMHDVDVRDHEISEAILVSFAQDPLAYSIFDLGVNNTGSKNAMQTLRETLVTRYSELRPDLHLVIEKRIAEAVSRQKLEAIAAQAAVTTTTPPPPIIEPQTAPVVDASSREAERQKRGDEEAERRRQVEERMKLQQEARKLREERERHERFIDCMNAKMRRQREMTFWEMLTQMFTKVWNYVENLITGIERRKSTPADECQLELV